MHPLSLRDKEGEEVLSKFLLGGSLCPLDTSQGTPLTQGKGIRSTLLLHPSAPLRPLPRQLGQQGPGGSCVVRHSHTLPLPSSKTKGALANMALRPGKCLLSPGWSCTGFLQALALSQPCPGSWNTR